MSVAEDLVVASNLIGGDFQREIHLHPSTSSPIFLVTVHSNNAVFRPLDLLVNSSPHP